MARKVSVTKKIMSSRFFFLSMCGCSFLDVIYSNKIAGFTRVFVSVLKIECWFFASITNQQRIWRETTRRKRGRRGRRGKVKAKFLHRTHTHTQWFRSSQCQRKFRYNLWRIWIFFIHFIFIHDKKNCNMKEKSDFFFIQWAQMQKFWGK